MTAFMTDDFLLDTEFARRLYHDYAKDQPIFDYHCHLPLGHQFLNAFNRFLLLLVAQRR
jgi:glucuronate isomerase